MLFTKLKTFILDIFFPVFCLGCRKEGMVFCDDCLNKIETYTKPFCSVCKFRLANDRSFVAPAPQDDNLVVNFHRNCREKTNLKKLIAAVSYSDPLIKKLIAHYKYQFIRELDQPLSQLIIKSLNFPDVRHPGNYKDKQEINKKLPDLSKFIITAVPLHKKRLQWRGFNQSELLGKKIGQQLNIEFQDLLKRTKDTDPQVKLNFEKRKTNIEGAFAIKNGINLISRHCEPKEVRCGNLKILNNKIILLVDDVYTSGFTMNECAKILKAAGAKEVWGVVVAK
ncbi:MAG: ComF family protein [Candidatus Staskawiczbacteria bacterium]|nr:ComF family protein [Candidatus Staskawiczbacteria bacterium]